MTSYYKPFWGFCLSHKERKKMKGKRFFVNINSNLNYKGHLSYGELYLKGKSKIVRNKKAFKQGCKKAIVTLKKGQSIDLSTGI